MVLVLRTVNGLASGLWARRNRMSSPGWSTVRQNRHRLGAIDGTCGMIKADDRKLCPPSRSRMKLSMESCARGEALGTPISFFGAVSFPVPPPRHSASLPVLRKNQVLPSSLIWREKEPSTSWEARHQVSGLMRITKLTRRSWLLAQQGGALPYRRRTRGSVRGGASGFQCTASKIRTSLPADHCRPILELGCWIRDPRSRLDQHPTERGQSLEATGWETKRTLGLFLSSSRPRRAKRGAFATEKANGQREGSRLSRTLAKLDSHSEALRTNGLKAVRHGQSVGSNPATFLVDHPETTG
ncbi:hypothetical protein L1987_87457 [Smallanthus sonchifolius]|nr:hypothetical protein L1987_87457 [Smallanthus sonchifolius]